MEVVQEHFTKPNETLLGVTVQLCAALAGKASRADQPLVHEVAAVPHDFICPIQKEIMIDPYMLVETGHSYEKAAIMQWLEANNTCPVSNKVLSKTKDIMRNHALRNSIQTWAAKHGVQLGAAPVYTPLFGGQFQLDAAASSVDQGSSQPAPAGLPGWVVGIGEVTGAEDVPSASGPGASLSGGKASSTGSSHGGSGGAAGVSPRAGMFRCTQTRWAIALGLLVVLLTAVIVIAVVVATKKPPKQPLASGAPAPPPAILPATTPQAQAKGETCKTSSYMYWRLPYSFCIQRTTSLYGLRLRLTVLHAHSMAVKSFFMHLISAHIDLALLVYDDACSPHGW